MAKYRANPVEVEAYKIDYWVIQSDGYVYLNPAKVFERKYTRIP